MNILKSAIVAITISLIFSTYANAAQQKIIIHKPPTIEKHFVYTAKDGRKLGVIEIQGEIDNNTVINVEGAFSDFKQSGIKYITIHLNSQGGSVSSGSQIGLDILNAEDEGFIVGTAVGQNEFCASMCTGVFAMGQIRMASPYSVWVFHSPYIKESFTQELWEFVNPFQEGTAKEALEWSRQTLLGMYEHADQEWADGELKGYVYSDDKKELVLTGAAIAKHSKSYITNFY